MKKNDFLKELTDRLCRSLPGNVKAIKEDIEKNFHAVLQKAFAKFELVTREEFDTQSKVLIRTRKKLDALEKEVRALEDSLNKK